MATTTNSAREQTSSMPGKGAPGGRIRVGATIVAVLIAAFALWAVVHNARAPADWETHVQIIEEGTPTASTDVDCRQMYSQTQLPYHNSHFIERCLQVQADSAFTAATKTAEWLRQYDGMIYEEHTGDPDSLNVVRLHYQGAIVIVRAYPQVVRNSFDPYTHEVPEDVKETFFVEISGNKGS
ncbi:MAG: hypothetical protein CSA58_06075 [Micrococcales bacterium]|nr:MAG: hypothetical protein CSA58_06075 [Micrococcales bacterium]